MLITFWLSITFCAVIGITNAYIQECHKEIVYLIAGISCAWMFIYSCLWYFVKNIIWSELDKRTYEDEKSEKTALLAETEKQVKIIKDYRLVLNSLLGKGTITAKYINETDKVVLRFEMIDDEGKPFSKTLEFDGDDKIIYDLEIL